MFEIFVRQFLLNLGTLARAGLARCYVPVEESLPFLRGRILFHEQLRRNVADQTRFHVVHDELSVNRPANRLIHSALARLAPRVRSGENRQPLMPRARRRRSIFQRRALRMKRLPESNRGNSLQL